MKKRWHPSFHGWSLRAFLQIELFPDPLTVTRSQTFTAYERLSTALTVAQVLRRPTVM